MASAKQVKLKKLMKEQIQSRKKVEHPLARYNNVGQLTCIICNVTVKSEILWSSHLQSKKHKEAVVNLKTQTKETPKAKSIQRIEVHSKRQLPEERADHRVSEGPSAKKANKDQKVPSDLPSDFFDPGVKQTVAYSDSESEPEDNGNEDIASGNGSIDDPPTAKDNTEQDMESSTSPKPKSTENKLPEGFFDDPKLDAKARHVEYKNPMEEEWEKFQKEMQQESKVAMAMQEEEDEVTNEDRELEDLKEQVTCFTRVEDLRLKQEGLLKDRLTKVGKHSEETQKEEEFTTDSDSDIEYDELLDWRKKRT